MLVINGVSMRVSARSTSWIGSNGRAIVNMHVKVSDRATAPKSVQVPMFAKVFASRLVAALVFAIRKRMSITRTSVLVFKLG